MEQVKSEENVVNDKKMEQVKSEENVVNDKKINESEELNIKYNELKQSFKKVENHLKVEYDIMFELCCKIRTKVYSKKLDVIKKILDNFYLLEAFVETNNIKAIYYLLFKSDFSPYFKIDKFKECFFIVRGINTKSVIKEKQT